MTAKRRLTIPPPCASRPPLALAVLVHRRDGFACVYCGARPTELHLDHLRPLAHFPAAAPASTVHAPTNLVTACADCNQAKGPQNLPGFAAMLRGRGAPSQVVAAMVRRVAAARRRPFPVPARP